MIGVREIYSTSDGENCINTVTYHRAHNIFPLWRMPITLFGGKLLVTNIVAICDDEGEGNLSGCEVAFQINDLTSA